MGGLLYILYIVLEKRGARRMSCIRLALRQSGVMRDNDRLKHLPPDELCWIQSGYSPITVFSDDPYYTASITLEFQRGRNDGVA